MTFKKQINAKIHNEQISKTLNKDGINAQGEEVCIRIGSFIQWLFVS